MTIKTPVRVEDLEGSTPWFGSLVEADGNPLLLSDIAAALNATATAPTSDPSVLRETALVLQQVYEDIVKAADSIDGAMDDLYRHIPDRPVVAALNATASAPDLTALREAVEAARASLARGDSEMEVTAKYLDIVDAAAALCPPKDGTP
jgi:hypothetical protein